MLSRRQFLNLIAAGVAAEVLLPLCEPQARAELASEFQDNDVHLKKRYTPRTKSYGSGDFGEWTTDSNGLPCYHYTCNQTEDPAAITAVETAWRGATDQTHQIGNDRILAAVSNYGYIQVRQDEGGPRFLNDYHPEEGLFGAGLGYLTDGEEILGTYYPGAGVSFERFFGMGYLRKQITGKNFSVDQTIYAPFGDDPVLISEVVISSQSPRTANLYWSEYWGCQPYSFSYPDFVDGHGPHGQLDPEAAVGKRRDAARRFSHHFERLPGGGGLLESKMSSAQSSVAGGPPARAEVVAAMAAPAEPPAPAAADEALPPPTFLASLDEGPVRCLTDAAVFFGSTHAFRHIGPAGAESVPVPVGLLRPPGLAKLTPTNAGDANLPADDLSASEHDSALILQKPLTLEAGETRTLRFLYGYLPKGASAAALIEKYRGLAPSLLAANAAAWKEEGIQFAVDSDPWVERESRWHSYYLRSAFTFDDAFDEHILSQGQTYQYCIGYQGAARDPLQHALPLIFGESRLAKEVLRYTLKSQGPDGALPFAITGGGTPVSVPQLPSDLDLWLLWLASEYVLATRDTAFLGEKISALPTFGDAAALTVQERLARCYRHLVDAVGIGKHGLLRGHRGDWNDNIYRQGVPATLADEVRRESESVMNAAMAACILDLYARMLRFAGDPASAKEAAERAQQQRSAVAAQWTGKWFKRLWLGPTAGWLGDDRLWLDGQPWAILGRCATPEQLPALVESIDTLLRKPSKIGAKQVSRPVDWPGFMPGEANNGGVWTILDGPLIWALAGSNGAMAWDEWKKNARAHHAEVYPSVWYGIWSGPDVYCSADSDHAGQTGYDWGLTDPDTHHLPSNYRGLSLTAWPVMNAHRHAWPLYSAAKLLGVEFTEAGVDLAPSIPAPEYRFHSRLLGLEKNAHGYQGWYAPQTPGTWTIRIRLSGSDAAFRNLTVNQAAQASANQSGNVLEFSGLSTANQPLRWSLSRD
jgi:hypothetical protein